MQNYVNRHWQTYTTPSATMYMISWNAKFDTSDYPADNVYSGMSLANKNRIHRTQSKDVRVDDKKDTKKSQRCQK